MRPPKYIEIDKVLHSIIYNKGKDWQFYNSLENGFVEIGGNIYYYTGKHLWEYKCCKDDSRNLCQLGKKVL